MTVGKAEFGRLGLNGNIIPRSSDPECAVPQVARLPGGDGGRKTSSSAKPVFSVTETVWREAREAIGKFKEAKERRIRDEDDTGEKRGDRGWGGEEETDCVFDVNYRSYTNKTIHNAKQEF